jgi:hypothetical protein
VGLTCTVTRSRGLVVAVVAALALGTGGVEPADAASVDRPSASDPECVIATVEESAAVQTAVACDSTVEVLSARTEWDTLYAQADGTMRWDSSAVAVRTEVSGAWTDVDPTVVATDGGLQVAAPVVPMMFGDGTDGQPLARLERDGHEMTFDVPLDLPVPSVEGRRITYPAVLPGVDLVVTVDADATGFSEVLRIESPEAAANPALAELTFPVEVSDGLDVSGENGGFVARDADGEMVFTSPAPAMWDSTTVEEVPLPSVFSRAAGGVSELAFAAEDAVGGETADPVVAPGEGARTVSIPVEVAPEGVTIAPDAEMLADPETVWPVYIDPSISGSRNMWTAVRDVYGQKYGFDPDEGVGLCNRATSTSCSATFKSRLLWTFTGLGTIGALSSSEILSATFAAVGTHSYDCTARPITAYRISDFSSATPWPGGGLWEPMSTQTVATKSTCAGQPVRWIEFDATSQARAIADANSDHGSIGLAADESSMASWKRFRNDATFSVTYNRAPSTPVGRRIVSGSVSTACGSTPIWVNTLNPTMRGVISDPDGDNVRAWFEIRSPTALVYTSPFTTALASGSEHAFVVPAGAFVNGGAYMWTMRGVDSGNVWGPAAEYCQVYVDTSPPVAPTVTAKTGAAYPTLYTEGAWAGGIGKAGGFQLGNGGSTDVLSYRYSFNNTALSSSVAGSSAVVVFTPTATGPQTLRVQSVDRAGNVSPVTAYTFNVAIPSASALWALDEGAGGVAVDSGPSGNRYPLALTGTPTWGNGPLAELDDDPSDRALVLDSTDDAAATSGPVIATHDSFTVGATVRLDATPTGGVATVLSQDGTAVSGFELGYRTDGACADGSAECWYFSMNRTDAVGTQVRATSSVDLGAGHWVYLAGVHDAGTDTLQLSVCSLEGGLVPQASAPVAFVSAWEATGPLRLGQGRQAGAAAWRGSVADAQVLDGVAGEGQIYRACNRNFSPTVDQS